LSGDEVYLRGVNGSRALPEFVYLEMARAAVEAASGEGEQMAELSCHNQTLKRSNKEGKVISRSNGYREKTSDSNRARMPEAAGLIWSCSCLPKISAYGVQPRDRGLATTKHSF
jgi:hypothetical protein